MKRLFGDPHRVNLWFGYDTNRRIYKMSRPIAALGAVRYAWMLRK